MRVGASLTVNILWGQNSAYGVVVSYPKELTVRQLFTLGDILIMKNLKSDQSGI